MKNARYIIKVISDNIEKGNINLAKKIIFESLDINPNYYYILKMKLSYCFAREKNYDIAVSILEELPEEMVFNSLMLLYLKLNDEKNIKKLYYRYYKNGNREYTKKYPEQAKKYELTKLYLDSKYKHNFNLNKTQQNSYIRRQLHNYNFNEVLQHIIKDTTKETTEKSNYFNETIDIKQIFYDVKTYIEKNPYKGNVIYNNGMFEAYLFYSPSCGKNRNGQTLNYFIVYTIIGTSKITSINPSEVDFIKKPCYLDTLYLDKPLVKSKVRKVASGLERFHKKYN